MATGNQVASFLGQIALRNVTAPLPDADIDSLQQLGLLQRFTAEQMDQLKADVARLEQARQAVVVDTSKHGELAEQVVADTRATHSVLFHLHGVDRQEAELRRLQQDQQALQLLDADLQQRQQAFAQLMVRKSLLDLSTSYSGGFLTLTPAGRIALRDLNVRLYRVGNQDFAQYWSEAAKVDAELTRIATQAASVAGPLGQALPDVDDRSYLWAVAIGIVKLAGDPGARLNAFVQAYSSVRALSDNVEDRLMTAEIVANLPNAGANAAALLGPIKAEALQRGVASEVALGVASILLFGRRADGSFAFDPLSVWLTRTASYESAALLAIENRPIDELWARFNFLRTQFAGWGYAPSEDTELSSAYLTLSDLPADSFGTKLAILARGLAQYLQYPLVGASILASIPVLEANETLNLLEKAYEILGQRTGPMSQAQLISLAVRMIHGLQVTSVDELDPTARVQPNFTYAGLAPRLWMPVFISQHVYYATYSGIGGFHPGHVHAWAGGGFVG